MISKRIKIKHLTFKSWVLGEIVLRSYQSRLKWFYYLFSYFQSWRQHNTTIIIINWVIEMEGAIRASAICLRGASVTFAAPSNPLTSSFFRIALPSYTYIYYYVFWSLFNNKWRVVYAYLLFAYSISFDNMRNLRTPTFDWCYVILL